MLPARLFNSYCSVPDSGTRGHPPQLPDTGQWTTHTKGRSVRLRNTFATAAILTGLIAAAGTASATTPATDGTADTTAATTATAETTPTTEYAPPARGDADLVIWADDTRKQVLDPIAAAFAAAEGVKVEVQLVPADNIRDSLSKAGPAGEGPDIIVGAHDWLGELVANGAVAPLDMDLSAHAEVATKAFTYDGKLYGLPYAIENIALIRNTDLVPEAPKTWADVEKTALDLKAQGKVEIPLAIQEGGTADPYHNYPLFTMTGASVFAQNEDGTYDPTKLGIDSPEGLESAKNFAKWSSEGLINKDVNYDIMIEKFASGQAPFAITGPWAVNDAERGFKVKGVKYVVEPIPPLTEGGTAPAVFVGVQGFMVSAFSKQPDLAKSFLADYVNTEDLMVQMFTSGGRIPSMTSAFDKIKSDPDAAGFGLAGQSGQPMPAIPAMASVWTAWTDGYTAIFNGGDPEAAFKDAATAIRAKIGG